MHNHYGIKQHINSPEFQVLTALFEIVVISKDMYMWQMKCQLFISGMQFVSWIYVINFYGKTSYFRVYTLEVLSELGTVDHNQHVFCLLYGRCLWIVQRETLQ